MTWGPLWVRWRTGHVHSQHCSTHYRKNGIRIPSLRWHQTRQNRTQLLYCRHRGRVLPPPHDNRWPRACKIPRISRSRGICGNSGIFLPLQRRFFCRAPRPSPRTLYDQLSQCGECWPGGLLSNRKRQLVENFVIVGKPALQKVPSFEISDHGFGSPFTLGRSHRWRSSALLLHFRRRRHPLCACLRAIRDRPLPGRLHGLKIVRDF